MCRTTQDKGASSEHFSHPSKHHPDQAQPSHRTCGRRRDPGRRHHLVRHARLRQIPTRARAPRRCPRRAPATKAYVDGVVALDAEQRAAIFGIVSPAQQSVQSVNADSPELQAVNVSPTQAIAEMARAEGLTGLSPASLRSRAPQSVPTLKFVQSVNCGQPGTASSQRRLDPGDRRDGEGRGIDRPLARIAPLPDPAIRRRHCRPPTRPTRRFVRHLQLKSPRHEVAPRMRSPHPGDRILAFRVRPDRRKDARSSSSRSAPSTTRIAAARGPRLARQARGSRNQDDRHDSRYGTVPVGPRPTRRARSAASVSARAACMGRSIGRATSGRHADVVRSRNRRRTMRATTARS